MIGRNRQQTLGDSPPEKNEEENQDDEQHNSYIPQTNQGVQGNISSFNNEFNDQESPDQEIKIDIDESHNDEEPVSSDPPR